MHLLLVAAMWAGISLAAQAEPIASPRVFAAFEKPSGAAQCLENALRDSSENEAGSVLTYSGLFYKNERVGEGEIDKTIAEVWVVTDRQNGDIPGTVFLIHLATADGEEWEYFDAAPPFVESSLLASTAEVYFKDTLEKAFDLDLTPCVEFLSAAL